jgi:hypothetical protein
VHVFGFVVAELGGEDEQVWRRRARPLAQGRPAGPAPRIRMSTGEVEVVGGAMFLYV